ncbi:MAG TPA: sialidase family protein [Pyrinomonadaceae bacterium]|nr:sialidase family protein [Pyrinomonadaceae bacterium]
MRIAAAALLLILVSASHGQQQPAPNQHFEIGEDRLVSVGGPDLPLVEPYLAINPKDPNNMLAAAMVITKPDLSGLDCAAFTTFDGGRTWTRHDFGLRSAADPWVAFLPDGTAVLSILELTERDETPLLVYRSTDGGRTWPNKPVSLGNAHDHSTLLVDRFSKQFAGSLYAVSARPFKNAAGKSRSAIYVARSTDGGLTFPNPVHVIASNLSYEANNPAILQDGTLLVPFADHRRAGDRRRLERQRDWMIVSTDGGKTFSEPMLISESCNGAGGWSSVVAGHTDNRIFHLCAASQFNGIHVRYSDTRGERWSDPIRVDRTGNYEPYTRTPAMAVNKDGVVGVVWYDGRNDPSTIKGTFRCQDIYFTASLDGGATFLPDAKISGKRSCPASPQHIPTALRFPAGGEYIGMIAMPDGAFQILWADNRTGTYQLRIATIKVKTRPS